MRIRGQAIRALTSATALLAVLAGSFAPMLACPAGCCFGQQGVDATPCGASSKGVRCPCCKLRSMKAGSATTVTAASRHTSDSRPCTCDLSPTKVVAATRACERRDGSILPSGWINFASPAQRAQTALDCSQLRAQQAHGPADAPFALTSRIQI